MQSSRNCPPRLGGDPEARHVEELSSCNFYSEMMEDPEQEKIRVSATQEGKRQKTKNFNNNKKKWRDFRIFKPFNYTCHFYSPVS